MRPMPYGDDPLIGWWVRLTDQEKIDVMLDWNERVAIGIDRGMTEADSEREATRLIKERWAR